jgi:hypothetical protein
MDGRLGVYQWLQFVALHARRHLVQTATNSVKWRAATGPDWHRVAGTEVWGSEAHASEREPGDYARGLYMWQAVWGAFSGDQHEPENNKPLGSEANEVLATGMFGR